MKKIILILLVLAFIVTPAHSLESQTSSLFDTSINGHGVVLEYKNTLNINSTAFDTYSPGIFVLQGDTFKALNYSGLVKVSVHCYQPYPYAALTFYGVTDKVYQLTTGQAQFYDMTFITTASAFQLSVYTDSFTFNVMKCRVLIEALK